MSGLVEFADPSLPCVAQADFRACRSALTCWSLQRSSSVSVSGAVWCECRFCFVWASRLLRRLELVNESDGVWCEYCSDDANPCWLLDHWVLMSESDGALCERHVYFVMACWRLHRDPWVNESGGVICEYHPYQMSRMRDDIDVTLRRLVT
jgi:hypothetical protein